ncbi:unnamed protein product [Prunus armeniaca]|uniref:Uncharacterized protein n=1 Tax=Prunus armeniaca TaxID=36596 RepID=A0A6J5UFT5_PRUAR|nr:unnamed protein product [Prunus armeniaca]
MLFWYRMRIVNLGYAFVNFTSVVVAASRFHEKKWEEVDNNNKTSEITCASPAFDFSKNIDDE